MASSFDINAAIQLQAPTNIDSIASSIQSKLTGIKANIDVGIPPGASSRITNLNERLKTLIKNLQDVAKNAGSAAAAIQAIGASLDGTSTRLSNLQSYLKAVSAGFVNIGRSVLPASDTIEKFGQQSALAARRFSAFTVAAGAIVGVVAGIKTGLSEAINFQQQIVKIGQITQQSTNNLKPLVDEVTRLGVTFGVSSKSLIEISNTLAQAGLSAKDTRAALEALAKTTLAPTFGDIKNTTEAAISSMAQFNIAASDFEKVFGSINSVAAAFAVEAQDLTTVITKTGGVFKTLSGDIDSPITQLNQLISLFTSVRQTTRESADTIATGFRTIFGRLERPQTLQFLEAMGVKLTDLKGNFIGVFPAVRELNKALSEIPSTSPEYAKIVEQIGGLRQISKVIPLIQQFPVALRALQVAQAGQNSLTVDASRSQEAFAQRLSKVKEEFLDLFRIISQNQVFTALADGFLRTATAIAQITKALEPLIPLMTAYAAIKFVPAAAQFGKGFFNYFTTQGVAHRAQGGEIPHFSRGGYVPGHGTGDTVPAMLEPKEFVIKQSSTAKVAQNHPGVLEYINKYGVLPQRKTTGDEITKYLQKLQDSTRQSSGTEIEYKPNELRDLKLLRSLKSRLSPVYKPRKTDPKISFEDSLEYFNDTGAAKHLLEALDADPKLFHKVQNIIPREARLIGTGRIAAAFGVPNSNEVFRVGADVGGRSSGKFSRTDSPLVVQPSKTNRLGPVIVERLPYAQSLHDLGFSRADIYENDEPAFGSRVTGSLLEKFHQRAKKAGLKAHDIHSGNIGFLGKRLMAIDPDAVKFAMGDIVRLKDLFKKHIYTLDPEFGQYELSYRDYGKIARVINNLPNIFNTNEALDSFKEFALVPHRGKINTPEIDDFLGVIPDDDKDSETYGYYQSSIKRLATNRKDSTIAHELTHAIDNQRTGSILRYSSEDKGSKLNEIISKLAARDQMLYEAKQLASDDLPFYHPNNKYFRYLKRPPEILARAVGDYTEAKILGGNSYAEEVFGRIRKQRFAYGDVTDRPQFKISKARFFGIDPEQTLRYVAPIRQEFDPDLLDKLLYDKIKLSNYQSKARKELQKKLQEHYISKYPNAPKGIDTLRNDLIEFSDNTAMRHPVLEGLSNKAIRGQLERLLPKDIETLGIGSYGAAVGVHGSNEVYRIGAAENHGGDPFRRTIAQDPRNNKPLVLPSLETKMVGNLVYERLPFAQTLKDLGLTHTKLGDRLLTGFKSRIEKLGYEDNDLAYRNIGFYKKQLLAIDPDAIIPNTFAKGDSVDNLSIRQRFQNKLRNQRDEKIFGSEIDFGDLLNDFPEDFGNTKQTDKPGLLNKVKKLNKLAGGGFIHGYGNGDVNKRSLRPQQFESNDLTNYTYTSKLINTIFGKGNLDEYAQELGGYFEDTVQLFKRRGINLGKSISKNRLSTNNQLLYRGFSEDNQKHISSQIGTDLFSSQSIGKSFINPGFTSTSFDITTAQRFGKLSRIITPENFKGIYTNRASQEEVILQAASRFKILDANKNDLVLQLLEHNKKKFATGGLIPGYGEGDSVPALLTPKEFVVKKDSAQSVGYSNLRYINEHGELPGYNKGGIVGMAGGGLFNREQEFGTVYSKLTLTGRDQLEAELYRANTRLLESLGEEYDNAKKASLAHRAFTNALNTGDKVITNFAGKIVGLGSIDELVKARKEVKRTGIEELDTVVNPTLFSKITGKKISKGAVAAGAVGLSLFGPELLRASLGEDKAKDITAGGGGAFAGLYTGGSIGASVGGVQGALVGAILGAITLGLTSYLTSSKNSVAEKQQKDIAEKQANFNEILSNNINKFGLDTKSRSAIVGTQGIISDVEKQAKAKAEEGSFFGLLPFNFSDIGATQNEIERRKKNITLGTLRESTLSGYAPALQNLEKLAQETRVKTGGTAEQRATEFETKLRATGGGAGEQLLTLVASFKSIAEGTLDRKAAEQELLKTLKEEAELRNKNLTLIKTSEDLADKFKDMYNNIGEFTTRLQVVNSKIEDLGGSLGDVLSGQNIKLNGVTQNLLTQPSRFTPDANSPFKESLDRLLEPLGAAGKELGSFILDERRAIAELDPILKSVARTSTARTIEQDIRGGLKQAGVSGITADSVIANLQAMGGAAEGLDKVLIDLQTDTTDTINKIKKDLLDFSTPLGQAGQQLDKLNTQIYESAIKISAYNDKVREETVRISEITLQQQEVGARRQAERFGGSPLNYISLQAEQEPFRQRVRSLAGTENPQQIGQNIISLSAQLKQLRDNASNLKDETAKLKFADLQTQIRNSEQALRLLANASERSAKIEERLSLLKQQEEGRFDFFKRLVTAKPEELPQLNKEITSANALVQHFNRGGSLDQLPASLRVEGASALAGPFSRFAFRSANNLTGEDILKQFQQRGLPSIGLPAGLLSYNLKERNEKGGLESEQNRVFESAKEAQQQIANIYQNAAQQQQEIFGQSVNIFKDSIAEFSKLLKADADKYKNQPLIEKRTVLTNALGRAPTVEDSELLNSFKRNKERIQEAVSAKGTLESLNKIKDIRSELPNILGKTGEDFDKISLNSSVGTRVAKLTNSGILPTELSEIFENVKKKRLEEIKAQSPLPYTFGLIGGSLDKKTRLQDQFDKNVQDDFFKILQDRLNKLKTDKTGEIDNARTTSGLGSQFDVFIDKFDQFGKVLENVDLNKFNDLISSLKSVPVAETKANGGSIFRPRGTDVVPAMLSPDEYIVNSRSSIANRPLLDRINSAKGPVYLAGGGEGSGKKRRRKRELSQEELDDLVKDNAKLKRSEELETKQIIKNFSTDYIKYKEGREGTIIPSNVRSISKYEYALNVLSKGGGDVRTGPFKELNKNQPTEQFKQNTGNLLDQLSESGLIKTRASELREITKQLDREKYITEIRKLSTQYKDSPTALKFAISELVTGQRGAAISKESRPELRAIQALEAQLNQSELKDPTNKYYENDEPITKAVKSRKQKAFTGFDLPFRKNSKAYKEYIVRQRSIPDYGAYGGPRLPIISSAATGLYQIDPLQPQTRSLRLQELDQLELVRRRLENPVRIGGKPFFDFEQSQQDILKMTNEREKQLMQELLEETKQKQAARIRNTKVPTQPIFPSTEQQSVVKQSTKGRPRNVLKTTTDVASVFQSGGSGQRVIDTIRPPVSPIISENLAIPSELTFATSGLNIPESASARSSKLLNRAASLTEFGSKLGLTNRTSNIPGFLFDPFEPPQFQGPLQPNIQSRKPLTQFLDFNGKLPYRPEYIEAQTKRPQTAKQLRAINDIQSRFDRAVGLQDIQFGDRLAAVERAKNKNNAFGAGRINPPTTSQTTPFYEGRGFRTGASLLAAYNLYESGKSTIEDIYKGELTTKTAESAGIALLSATQLGEEAKRLTGVASQAPLEKLFTKPSLLRRTGGLFGRGLGKLAGGVGRAANVAYAGAGAAEAYQAGYGNLGYSSYDEPSFQRGVTRAIVGTGALIPGPIGKGINTGILLGEAAASTIENYNPVARLFGGFNKGAGAISRGESERQRALAATTSFSEVTQDRGLLAGAYRTANVIAQTDAYNQLERVLDAQNVKYKPYSQFTDDVEYQRSLHQSLYEHVAKGRGKINLSVQQKDKTVVSADKGFSDLLFYAQSQAERDLYRDKLARSAQFGSTEKLGYKDRSGKDILESTFIGSRQGLEQKQDAQAELQQKLEDDEEFRRKYLNSIGAGYNRQFSDINKLNNEFGGADLLFKADGGSIFKKRGTDTIPAMLSPDEFIVNATSAKANRDILEKINAAKGPIYKADGGFIKKSKYTKEELDRILAGEVINKVEQPRDVSASFDDVAFGKRLEQAGKGVPTSSIRSKTFDIDSTKNAPYRRPIIGDNEGFVSTRSKNFDIESTKEDNLPISDNRFFNSKQNFAIKRFRTLGEINKQQKSPLEITRENILKKRAAAFESRKLAEEGVTDFKVQPHQIDDGELQEKLKAGNISGEITGFDVKREQRVSQQQAQADKISLLQDTRRQIKADNFAAGREERKQNRVEALERARIAAAPETKIDLASARDQQKQAQRLNKQEARQQRLLPGREEPLERKTRISGGGFTPPLLDTTTGQGPKQQLFPGDLGVTPIGPTKRSQTSEFQGVPTTQAGASPGAATNAPQAQAQQAFDVGGLAAPVKDFGGFISDFGKHVSSLTDLAGKLTDLKVTLQTDKLTVTVAEKDILTEINKNITLLLKDKIDVASKGGPDENGNLS